MAFTRLVCRDGMDITARVPGRLNSEGVGVQVSPGYWASHFPARAPELVQHQARFHPHRLMHDAPAGLRALATAREHPNCVVSGLSALALMGLPFLADSCDTTLNSPVGKIESDLGLVRRRRKTKQSWTVKWRGTNVTVSTPPDAVVEALQDIRDGIHAWSDSSWCSDVELIWAVQLIDAVRRYLGVPTAEIEKAAHGRLNRRRLKTALALSSPHADSPKETEMRLMVRALSKDPTLIGQTEWAAVAEEIRVAHLAFEEQVPLYQGFRLITTFDLAFPDLKIAIMYDGEHHLSRGQRDKDFRIGLECQLQGWTVIRVSAGTLDDLPLILFRLLKSRGVVG